MVASPSATAPVVNNFRAINKPGSAAKGVFDVTIGDFRISGAMLLESNGKRWWNLPAQKQFGSDGKPATDPKTGKQAYSKIIEFSSREANDRLQSVVLAAIAAIQGGDL